jgi:dihydroneopterin aldolase
MDQIFINDLRLECIIGVLPHERETPQPLWINVTLDCDLSRAGASDALEHTVDYKALADAITDLAVKSEFFLIERLAEAIAARCLESAMVCNVTVRIDKPQALDTARSAAVQLTRRRL